MLPAWLLCAAAAAPMSLDPSPATVTADSQLPMLEPSPLPDWANEIDGNFSIDDLLNKERSSALCNRKGCWPAFQLIGVQKAATTSLFDYLHAHHLVCGNTAKNAHPIAGDHAAHMHNVKEKTLYKEPHFFSEHGDQWDRGRIKPVHYLAMHQPETCRARNPHLFMDATPEYSDIWNAPKRMHSFYPLSATKHVRILMILRDPIARDVSEYNMLRFKMDYADTKKDRREMYESVCPSAKHEAQVNTYPRAVVCAVMHFNRHSCWHKYESCANTQHKPNRLLKGLYAHQIKRWVQYYNRKHFLVVGFDSLIASSHEVLPRVLSFMGLPIPRNRALPASNPKQPGSVTSIPCHLKAKLEEHIFKKANHHLRAYLEADRAAGRAPSQEQPLDRFTQQACHSSEDVSSEQLWDTAMREELTLSRGSGGDARREQKRAADNESAAFDGIDRPAGREWSTKPEDRQALVPPS